ncbi:ribonuclease J [Jannaschia aquimarina]|uniref:RnjA protein n=1 Tax=Jannaschia aquimarina TaxID=935700 RepID=A0A0D1DD60_9RHOB|nr:ribonuclease J [Jannaschia aquimarina]KIT17928.1 Ribonuclease J 1 [Jannaschia aquimarina]SNT08756.1 ribonuclease J [Jannaschia aquimarina]
MSRDRLIYLPLGGAGEIGMNAYVYGYGPEGKERLILVDLGIAFPDMDTTPGVDVILPDISWLEDKLDRLEGVFITHAHEDHVGGVGHLHGKLNAQIHARAFTANHARRKLKEQGHDEGDVTICDPWPATTELGPFKIGFVPISHSIPESSALVIDTPAGRIVHSGDFKIDHTPVLGEPFDEDLFREVAKGGVRALVCDSTNVFNAHEGRSESTVGPNIRELVAASSGMFVATTFASNVARLKSLADAGEAAGRSICLMGRAMRRMTEAAVEEGILTEFPRTVSPEDAADIPRENLMLIVTGSQGERRAASAQLSQGKYFGLEMKQGDTFLFSSKTIPGNEKDVARIINNFSEMGVDVVSDSDLYHVSGHANRPDLEAIQALLDPQVVIPMHGEHRHLREHAKLADGLGRVGVLAPNGTMVDLAGNKPTVVDHVETGRTYLDGATLVGQFDGVIRDRIRMALNGHAVVALMIEDDDQVMEDTWVDLRGLPEAGRSRRNLAEEMERDLAQRLERVDRKTARDDDALESLIKKSIQQVAQEEIGKRPEVTVLITRLTAE